jgi:hypothetical protein
MRRRTYKLSLLRGDECSDEYSDGYKVEYSDEYSDEWESRSDNEVRLWLTGLSVCLSLSLWLIAALFRVKSVKSMK